MNGQWWDAYTSLDLCGGKIVFISDDENDMIEIKYPDKMMIDVGYIYDSGFYEIAVVNEDTKEAWKKPLEILDVFDKKALYSEIQNIIYKYKGR